jgi:cell division protein FtsN
MKTRIFLSVLVVFALGCKPKKNIVKSRDNRIVEEQIVPQKGIEPQLEEKPVIIKEETLVSVGESAQFKPNENFFVVLGSFKILENAKKFQNELNIEGFKSQILQNDQGLYRVSAFTYKEIADARSKVLTIRKEFPKYNDVWLLRKQN